MDKTKLQAQKQPGELGVYNLKVTLTAGGLSILVMAVAIIAYCALKNFDEKVNPKAKEETLDFIVKTIGTGLAIVSVAYVGDNIRGVAKARADEENLRKIDRSLKLIERWNSPAYNTVRKKIIEKIKTIREKETDRSKHPILLREEMISDTEFNSCGSDLMNFLEEIGLTVKQGLAEETILKDYFSFILASYLKMFSAWIDHRQEQAVSRTMTTAEVARTLYENAKALNSRWSNNNQT